MRRPADPNDDRSDELAHPPALPLPEDAMLDAEAEAIRELVARRLFGSTAAEPDT